MDKWIATYEVNGRKIDVYACYSTQEQKDNDDPEFFDIYETSGGIANCLNEGVPFFPDTGTPTREEVKDFVDSM